ncbi:hypothetical protein [uncultured Kocuria sp.]|uniref:hypothetical protein n=1 Tax=uncultured Kocuria sp. TaxID=259305 RepID=UPI0026022436|nr:hypothetical protein [uncultured Kocuria sp.]
MNSVVIGLGLTVVLEALILMPLMLGMPLFVVDTMALFSLMGHLVYGLILGLIAVRVLRGRA